MLATLPTRAQEPTPLPPLVEETPEADSGFDDEEDHEDAPKTPALPVDKAQAEAVARDAMLGGAGVLGPFMLVNVAAYVAPLLGGLAAAWSQEQANPEGPGAVVRGVVSSYAGTLVEQLTITVGSALTTGLVYVLFLPAYAGELAMMLPLTGLVPIAGTAAMGVTLLLMGGVLGYMGLVMGIALGLGVLPTFVGNVLGVMAADLAWENVNVRARSETAEPEAPDILTARIHVDRPLERLQAAGLVAAATAGAWKRAAFWSFVPVVGPTVAFALARSDVVERAEQARAVAGLTHGPGMSPVVTALLAGRTALYTVVHVALAAMVVAFVVSAVPLMGAGVALLATPSGALPAMALLMTALVVLLGGTVAGSLAGAALTVAPVLDMLIPWGTALYGVMLARGPAEGEPAQ
ncbi:MAG: hypothetical protein AB2A00_40510 [Myxococcota bacterium]